MNALYKTRLQAGRALEKLAHAIEYLTDELALETGDAWRDPARIRAIQILMDTNRAVYLESVATPSFRERVLRFCGLSTHDKISEALYRLKANSGPTRRR